MAFRSIRDLIDIVEGKYCEASLGPSTQESLVEEVEAVSEAKNKNVGRREWGITMSNIFADSLAQHRRVFPDLDAKLSKFIEVKKENPLQARYGKHDGPFTAVLVGFWHCHLRDDAILIYNLKNNAINLICVVAHAEIEGKKAVKMSKKIAAHR